MSTQIIPSSGDLDQQPPITTKKTARKYISGELIKAVIHITIGVIIGVSSRYLIDHAYNAMRRGGLTPELPFVHTNDKGEYRQTDVYLIPYEGFSEQAASQLALFLSEDLDLVVKATGNMPLPSKTWDPKRKQHISDAFFPSLWKYGQTLTDTKPNTLYIGMLADDMYPENSSLNFCFALHAGVPVSIVATDRLIPHGILNKQKAGHLYGIRLSKLIKRVIGTQYYHYSRSTDPHSLLYSPLMNVDELDRMGTEF